MVNHGKRNEMGEGGVLKLVKLFKRFLMKESGRRSCLATKSSVISCNLERSSTPAARVTGGRRALPPQLLWRLRSGPLRQAPLSAPMLRVQDYQSRDLTPSSGLRYYCIHVVLLPHKHEYRKALERVFLFSFSSPRGTRARASCMPSAHVCPLKGSLWCTWM